MKKLEIGIQSFKNLMGEGGGITITFILIR
jgi:hypothetical protein